MKQARVFERGGLRHPLLEMSSFTSVSVFNYLISRFELVSHTKMATEEPKTVGKSANSYDGAALNLQGNRI